MLEGHPWRKKKLDGLCEEHDLVYVDRYDTYVEDLRTGMRHVVNRAYLTEVCVDEDGRPTVVPYGLNVRTENERAEWQGAEKRIELRKQRRREGF